MQEKIKFSQKKEALLAKTMPLKDIYAVMLVAVLDFVNYSKSKSGILGIFGISNAQAPNRSP